MDLAAARQPKNGWRDWGLIWLLGIFTIMLVVLSALNKEQTTKRGSFTVRKCAGGLPQVEVKRSQRNYVLHALMTRS